MRTQSTGVGGTPSVKCACALTHSLCRQPLDRDIWPNPSTGQRSISIAATTWPINRPSADTHAASPWGPISELRWGKLRTSSRAMMPAPHPWHAPGRPRLVVRPYWFLFFFACVRVEGAFVDSSTILAVGTTLNCKTLISGVAIPFTKYHQASKSDRATPTPTVANAYCCAPQQCCQQR